MNPTRAAHDHQESQTISHPNARVPTAPGGALAEALRLDGMGLHVVPVHSKRTSRDGKGKAPIGEAWGVKRRGPAGLRSVFAGRYFDAGVGLCVGPGKAPDGVRWLFDLEGDGGRADASLLDLFAGEVVDTMGWSSRRGRHNLFVGDERFVEALAAAGAVEGKGLKAGTYHLEAFPDLEFRVGGYKPDGTVKQLQSVCPPTPGEDDVPRAWNGVEAIAEIPAAALARLAEVAAARPRPAPKAGPAAPPVRDPFTASAGRRTPEERAALYLATIDGGVSGKGGSKPMFRAACKMVEYGLDYEAALRLLRDVYNPKCEPEWSEDELRHKLDDAFAKAEAGKMLAKDARAGRASGAGSRRVGPPTGIARPVAASPPAGLPEFCNFVVVGEGEDERRVGVSMAELDGSLRAVAGGWPKRVGEVLFVEAEGCKPRYLRTPPALFAWLDRRARVSWTKGASFISQERFFEDRRAEAEGYDAIESLPHFPPVERVYYMHPPVPAGDGSKLEALLDFFSPATPHDRQILKALVLTLFWGGPPGARPAFIIQGPEDDGERMGVGVGKSKTSQILAEELVDGYLGMDQRDPDIEALKTRIVSSEAGRKRVGFVDNLKTHKFSCGGLEGLITETKISGRALYVGNGERPNLMVWIFTVNGARVSKDIAERSIFLRLARPTYRAGWEGAVRSFIRTHRAEIMGDVRFVLESQGDQAFAAIDPPIRWADWCRDVLAKVQDPMGVVGLLLDRQEKHDADADVRGMVIDYFRERLEEHGHDPDADKVLIPNAFAYKWVDDVTRRKRDADSTTGFLEGLAIPGMRRAKSGNTRGWVWTGPACQRVRAEMLRTAPATAF